MRNKIYKRKKHRGKHTGKFQIVRLCLVLTVLLASTGILIFLLWSSLAREKGGGGERRHGEIAGLLKQYYSCIEEENYDEMYRMLDARSRSSVSAGEFTSRNQHVYQTISASDVQVQITETEDVTEEMCRVTFEVKMETIAGELSFSGQTVFSLEEDGAYRLAWDNDMIFPDLAPGEQIRVSVKEAKRGSILDRNGMILAGEGTATQVGLVPGKMNEDSGADVEQLAQLLGMPAESIRKKLEAEWVKSDSFVPLKTVEKLTPLEQMTEITDEKTVRKAKRDAALLKIPGVMLTDTPVRHYSLGSAGAHLIGYIQTVTEEDLEKHPGEGYTGGSKIGRSGIERAYEKELKGQTGYEVYVADSGGEKRRVLASIRRIDGQDIRLTIDYNLQKAVYETYAEDKSCTVVMNPYTGEVLALVSTPTFDSNDFVLGMPEELWNSLNEDERKPLYNRFRQKLCPGSTIKPVIAAVGMDAGVLNPDEDYGDEGRRWQKDESWGNYFVTTLHAASPANLLNALIYSDNIYFAKAALKIGAGPLKEGLDRLGFNEAVPFEVGMAASQYSNTEEIESEVQLADSGYGQGQMLVNPVHLAALYTGFANGGDVIKPYLLYKNEPESEIWIRGAYQPETADRIKAAMEQVVQSEGGTGRGAHRADILLAAKTGTAELKQTKDDAEGTELGWFGIFTEDPGVEKPVLILSMVEDVRDRGGSGYVVGKTKQILDGWFVTEPDPLTGTENAAGLPTAGEQPEEIGE